MRLSRFAQGLMFAVAAAGLAAPAAAQGWRASESRVHRASDLIGKDVRNYANEDLGTISELVINVEEGQIVYAVLEYDNQLAAQGNPLFAVPWDALTLVPADEMFALDIGRAQLLTGPNFRARGAWPSTPQSDLFAAEGRFRTSGDRSRAAQPYERQDYGQRDDQLQQPGQDRVEWDRQNPWIHRVTRLMGTDVENYRGNDLGNLQDLMVDMREGRIAYAILASGGFLGLGQDLVPVPWSALKVEPEDRRLVLGVSEDRLRDAPGFGRNAWPDMADQRWGQRVHEYYGVAPYYEVYGYGYGSGEPVEPAQPQRFDRRSRHDQRYQQGQPYQNSQPYQQDRQSRQQFDREGRLSPRIDYDRQQERTLRGTIRGISRDAHEGERVAQDVLHLQVRTDEGRTYTVHLPGQQVLQQRGVALNRGSHVEVIAAPAQVDGRREIVARQVRIDGRTIELIDHNGNLVGTYEGQSGQGQDRRRMNTGTGQTD